MGTPGYAPPEQYRGDISVASDIYALGATIHHLLTGRDPRGQKPFSFPPVRDLAPHVSQLTSDVVHRALQLNPNERFLSANDMRAAIRAVIRSEDTNILPIIRDTGPISTRAIISPGIEPSITHTLVEPKYATNVIAPLDDQQHVVTNELSFVPVAVKPLSASQPQVVIPTPPKPTPSRWHVVAFVLITIVAMVLWWYIYTHGLVWPLLRA
jgi:serine/threonine protein kinase